MKTLEEILDELPKQRRKKVETSAAQLIAEEMTLQDLRKAHRRTQTQLAKKLHMTQGQVSRLEQRSDLLLSTLRKFIESMGGQLSLIAEFPAQSPVKLAGFAALKEEVLASRPLRNRFAKPTALRKRDPRRVPA